jgi:hypothetical protein
MKLLRAAQIAVLSLPLLLTGVLGLIMATPAPALAACSNLSSSLGTDTVSVNIPSYGAYRVWVRELATAANASSFYLQVPDAGLCAVSMGGSNIATNTWTWVDYSVGNTSAVVNATLSAGSHSVEMAGQSNGVELDKVMFLSDTSCTPTGDGSNCTQGAVASASPTPGPTGGSGSSPTPSPTTVPVGGSSGGSGSTDVSGDISLSPVDIPADATNVQYFLDGQPISSDKVNTADLANGKHTITVKATLPDGKTVSHSTTITVNNKHSLLQNVTGFIQAHRPEAIGAAVIIIAAPIALFAAAHFGLIGAGAATGLAGAGQPAMAAAGGLTLPSTPGPTAPSGPSPDGTIPQLDNPAEPPSTPEPPAEPPATPPTV